MSTTPSQKLERMVYIDMFYKTATVIDAYKFNEWERNFLLDLAKKWIDRTLWPANWSAKQIETIERLYKR